MCFWEIFIELQSSCPTRFSPALTSDLSRPKQWPLCTQRSSRAQIRFNTAKSGLTTKNFLSCAAFTLNCSLWIQTAGTSSTLVFIQVTFISSSGQTITNLQSTVEYALYIWKVVFLHPQKKENLSLSHAHSVGNDNPVSVIVWLHVHSYARLQTERFWAWITFRKIPHHCIVGIACFQPLFFLFR